MKSPAADPEFFSGARAVSSAFIQGAFDQQFFIAFEVAVRRSENSLGNARRHAFADVDGHIVDVDLPAPAEHHHAFHAVPKLADVSGHA